MMAKFVVLEKWGSNSYARIHRTICSHAREPGAETASTFCHGYFDTYLEARDFARSLGRESMRECTLCSPRNY
jgi:hypothetical protein